MDPSLFPELPEDLAALSDEELASLLAEHESAAELINADDKEFLGELSAEAIIAQYEQGVEQIKSLRAESDSRVEAHEAYEAKKAELAAEIAPKAEEEEPTPDEPEPEGEEEKAELVAEAESETETPVEEPVLVTASAEAEEPAAVTASVIRYSRHAPPTSPERIVVQEPEVKGTALVASSAFRAEHPGPLDPDSLANLMRDVCIDLGPTAHDGRGQGYSDVHFGDVLHFDDGHKEETGWKGRVIWDGPKTKVARAEFPFPGDRILDGGPDDMDKIRAALPPSVKFGGKPGQMSQDALVASGGLCAPSTPFYSMPNFGTEAEPVWDSFPVFTANRGGVNIPTATYIVDITTAISSISEANDQLGGTFATKSCQALVCPSYTETQVQIFAHCREYGNLNARAWPEKIAHENALTMQALSRTSEGFMLDRIKSFFPNTTNGATTLALTIFLVEAIVQYRFGIIGRFRMPLDSRFRVLMPYYVRDLLGLDTITTPFDRFRSADSVVDYLRGYGVDITFYHDSPSTGTTQLPDASQTAAAQDETPADIQWAIYPEGAVLGIDMGVLELGIVRDSDLNSSNDFQIFGERFRNVALIAPAQAGWWVTTTYCAGGQLPPAGTALDCPS